MKIRTDFVTNSSSSSFTVTFEVDLVNGKHYESEVGVDYDVSEWSEVDVCCTAESLLKKSSVAELMDSLYDAIEINGIRGENIAKYLARFRALGTRVKKNASRLDEIERIRITRAWMTWGEYASCFGYNIEHYAPELCKLANEILNAYSTEDKLRLNNLKKQMLYHLLYHNAPIGQQNEFNAGFMGIEKTCRLNIVGNDGDLIKFSRNIASGHAVHLDNDDDGYEEVVINFQTNSIQSDVVYGNAGFGDWKKAKAEVADIVAAVEEEKRQKYAAALKAYRKLLQRYQDLVGSIDCCQEIPDFFNKKFYGFNMNLHAELWRQHAESVWSLDGRIDYFVLGSFDYIDGLSIEQLTRQYESLNGKLQELKYAIEKSAATGMKFIKLQTLLDAIMMEEKRGRPSLMAHIANWKSSIPFDHVSTIDIAGKSFAAAGLDSFFSLGDSVKSMIIARGGIIKENISRQCDFLIVGLKSTAESAKVVKAIAERDSGKSNIKIIPEDELLRMLNGEVLTFSEEEQAATKAREEAWRQFKDATEQKRIEKERQAEENRQKRAAEKLRRAEAKRANEEAVQELKRQLRMEAMAEKEQQKAIEQAAKAEKQKQAEAERALKIQNSVLYRPGEEPQAIRQRIDRLFAKLDEAYPDKQIVAFTKDHKKWAETAGEIRKALGYPDTRGFLEAYGYIVADADNKGGRPTTDHEAIIEELKRRYAGRKCKSLVVLRAENPDIKFNTLNNNAQKLFGMSLGDYLKEIGVLW